MDHKVVGRSIQRKDGVKKVTGNAIFGADIDLPGQLYGAVCRSPYPHAKIKAVHKKKALELPGVYVVLTGAECDKLFGQYIEDQPVIAREKVRYQGEPVALVAADNFLTAQEAASLIEVEYEPLPVIDSVEDALKNEILLHEDWSKYNIVGDCHPVKSTNIGDIFTLSKGDVNKGFMESDLIVESEFSCSMLQHTTIETHCATAYVNKSTREITVYSPAQSPFAIRSVLARSFGVPLENVRVICTEIGGAFGSKYEAKAEPLAIALAMFTNGRPVKIQFSREEEFLASVARGPVKFKIKTGVKNDGTLLAQDVTIYWDTGAYVTTGPRINYNAGFAACGPYKIPNAKVESFCVVTNKSIATAYRGFGVPEVVCAHEHQMDLIAKKLGIDPLEIRLKNILTDGDLSVTGETMQDIAVKECLEAAAKNVEWYNKPLRWISSDGKFCGKGIACFCKLTGTPSNTSVILRLNENGSLTILDASREMGQGVTTVLPQIAAEALGMDVEKISVSPVDTAFSPYDKTTTSSRSTFHGGNAVLLAAEEVKKQLLALAAKYFKVSLAQMEYVEGNIRCKNDLTKSIHINEIGKSGILREQPPIIGVGAYSTVDLFDKPDPTTHQSKRPTVMWMFGAQAAIVEVDPKEGHIQVKTIGAAHDVGYAINPLGCLQQIEGSIIMGIGHALTEEMIYKNGDLKNGNMLDYKVPTFMDSDVDIHISLVEKNHKEGPFGAKGLGEPGVAATAAAIVNAINTACETNFNAIPIKPENIIFKEEV
ncbi:xanthine dehydrogenase family protein molybdopterin-binding subunit [Tepidanaerobacter syntrophicus]|uniref:xanthine dehydrogenase family protein molybdopterin-binding subunit n=1 Tax=Tepidanaerobacter syntrophicus TaxID=224999 RepID=UPI001BD2691B|nr:xanthine dehydrogenase family protein molybdopterin-binding subunit [Tepidanaerobacter syntrophicus]